MSPAPRVGVLGATGLVGRTLLERLATRWPRMRPPRVFASPARRGTPIPWRDGALALEVFDADAASGLDLLFSCVEAEIARDLVPLARRAGALVVDNSSAFRHDPDVPLVVPAVNGAALARHRGLVANPNCSTILAALVLGPLERNFGLEDLVVSTYQAASGAGAAGLQELRKGLSAAVAGTPPPRGAFEDVLVLNALPRIGAEGPDGESTEERKMRAEARRILERPDLPVLASCVRIPTERAHLLSATVRLARKARPSEVLAVLARAPRVRVVDLPRPSICAGRPGVAVGRVRAHPDDPRRVAWFACGDQLLEGAAENALLIAEAAGEWAPR